MKNYTELTVYGEPDTDEEGLAAEIREDEIYFTLECVGEKNARIVVPMPFLTKVLEARKAKLNFLSVLGEI